MDSFCGPAILNGWSVRPHGSDTEPPWLDVDAFIPKARLGGSDSDCDGTGNIKIDEVIAGCGMGNVDGLVIDGDRKGSGASSGGTATA